ncbi:MAG: alpha-amylase family glycosyl hydrolase, partial [Deltaproteobacteria bacterium]|nr:alpha-amylase family glycosyl hydrolase [Deltaproteobacteria bacterium]
MRPHPVLYEASARLLLNRLSAGTGRPLSLARIPVEFWRRLEARGFDLLWLMGVWRRSAEARGRALAHADLREAYGRALPDWKDSDVEGSPYAVAAYTLDPALGAEGDLALLRDNLHRAGLGLILDFVPNHIARDHAWTRDHPDRFVRALSEKVLHAHPGWFFETAGGVRLAHGRDPNFPSWDDTAQVNFFSAEAREALVGELLRIAGVADGVRCDMAMLALTDIFGHVWGRFLPGAARPPAEFWSEAIARVRAQHPGFIFIAEAYWGSEPRLLDLGFDYTYDKTLYDRLLHGGAEGARHHLESQGGRAARWVRFIENHDEARATAAFGRERSLAAATAALTLPGLRLIHDGQMEGRRARLPVQLL